MVDLKKTALTIGIAVIFAFLVYFAIDVFYPRPLYEDFCKPYAGPSIPSRGVYKENIGYVTTCNCTTIPGISNLSRNCSAEMGNLEFDYDDRGCETGATCNMCNAEYNKVMLEYNLNYFYITAPIGLAAIIAGMYLPLLIEAIAAGFMFGGIFSLYVSTVFAFDSFGKWARMIILFLELCIVIWIGIKKVSAWKPGMDLLKEKEVQQVKEKGK